LGPASALYGPGVGAGVVHYLSKDPFKHPGTTINLQAGGFDKGGSFDMNMYKMDFRHAVSNDENTFGYKFNLKFFIEYRPFLSRDETHAGISVNFSHELCRPSG